MYVSGVGPDRASYLLPAGDAGAARHGREGVHAQVHPLHHRGCGQWTASHMLPAVGSGGIQGKRLVSLNIIYIHIIFLCQGQKDWRNEIDLF